ncbi:MAG: acyl-CoA thioesterase II [Acidobacteriota bacterium]|nr:acyl-CoA thioesterase II [Acidobacteriota bacterium]
MAYDFDELLYLLRIEKLDHCLFRGLSPSGRTHPVFGGQVIAQAIMAATDTVPEERRLHSMHAYFLRPGNAGKPIIFFVDPIRDGKSFTTRRVVARQNGEAIFNTSLSYQVVEQGSEHQEPMPEGELPDPETLESDREFWDRIAESYPDRAPKRENLYTSIDCRPVLRYDPFKPEPRPPERMVWMRANGRLPDNPVIHRAVLGYLSDLYFMSTAMLPHGLSFWKGNLQAASLDHALWLHADCRADEWMLYVMKSSRAGGSRGLNHGRLYTRDGTLVASTAQEGLMRVRESKS